MEQNARNCKKIENPDVEIEPALHLDVCFAIMRLNPLGYPSKLQLMVRTIKLIMLLKIWYILIYSRCDYYVH